MYNDGVGQPTVRESASGGNRLEHPATWNLTCFHNWRRRLISLWNFRAPNWATTLAS